MKILLINPPIENTMASIMPKELEEGLDFLPPLGLMYLAGYLKEKSDYQVEILDCPVERISHQQLRQEITRRKPQVIGITTMTFTLIDVIKTAQTVKSVNQNIKVVLGGPHTIIYPQETINVPEIDFLVLGEGEKIFKELLDNLDDKDALSKIPGLVFKSSGQIVQTAQPELIEDLDSLPIPARNLLPYQKYFSVVSNKRPVTTMFTSRGCPFNCLFCDRPHIGKKFRARSAQSVVNEMAECEKMGIREIFIYDDTFTINRQRVVDICREIMGRGLKICWDIRARVDTVDEELIKLMKRANCQRIHYGVEAGTSKILKVLRKGITLEQVKDAFNWSKKHHIQTVAYFMIGSPSETREDILETIKLAKKTNPDFFQIAITTPFPATDLYRLGLERGVIKKDYWLEFAKNPNPNFTPPVWSENLSQKELLDLLRYAYRSFYFRPSYIIKRLKELGSLEELKTKAKAAWRMFRI